MPSAPHIERHFTAGATVRDVVIGMADGLTVPFALAAGLSGAVDASKIVVVAGLAVSASVTAVALAVFGYVKGHFTGAKPLRSAVQTLGIGSIAAAAAFGLAKLLS